MKAKHLLSAAATCGCLATLAQPAGAAVLALYDFTGQTLNVQNVSPAATSAAANVTASTITAESAARPRITLQTKSVGGIATSPLMNIANIQSTQANADYVMFTVSAAAGYEMDLSSLTLNVVRGGTSLTRGYYIRSSIDNYAADLVGQANIPTTNSEGAGGSWLAQSADLSAIAGMQDAIGPVTFRIYAFVDGGGTADSAINFDDITVNGAVSAVPEPGALALFAGSSVILLRRRKA